MTVGCSTTTSYTDSSVQAGTTYYYVVSAQYTGGPNAGGASADSIEANATTQQAGPLPPTGLKATAGNTQVALSWNASSGATSYNVKRATVSGGPYTMVASLNSTNYTDTGLTNGTTYYYVVTAVNSAGQSGNSSEVSATPQGAGPLPPTGLTATAGNTQVALSWNASSGATSYNVKRATVSGGPYTMVASLNSTNYTDTGLTNGTTYYYVVTAVNSAGQSGNSSEVSATPQAATSTAPPTNLTANATKPGSITLRWTQSTTPGVTQNSVYRRTSNGVYPPTATVTTSATTSYVDGGLLSARPIAASVVTAVSSSGESARSNEACATAK